MRSDRRLSRRVILPAVGVVLGLASGIATVAWSAPAAGRADVEPRAVFDATHLPPLLRMPTEQVELSYDVHCALEGSEAPESGCDVRGQVFVRQLGGNAFAELDLEPATGGDRDLVASVPESLARGRGFEYFAVLEAAGISERLVVPGGGAAAPHVSRILEGLIDVDLGVHSFRRYRRVGTRIAAAGWGDGPTQAGLEPGRNLDPIGASAFDVDLQGDVLILDQVHRRLLRWRPGAEVPRPVPVSVNGTLADMAAADDGSVFVLETTAHSGRNPKVKRFDDGGRELEAVETAERASQIRIDAHGPTVLGGGSHHWLPVTIGGTPATPTEQLARGRNGRRFEGGREVVVYRHENEVRLALVTRGAVTRAWRLTSDTSLAEVQLAQPLGGQVVVVLRVYDEDEDEFAVLTLGREGMIDSFALDTADWAEAAPLGRFRLVGRSLFRLGSTRAGVFVDRFDLEVR